MLPSCLEARSQHIPYPLAQCWRNGFKALQTVDHLGQRRRIVFALKQADKRGLDGRCVWPLREPQESISARYVVGQLIDRL